MLALEKPVTEALGFQRENLSQFVYVGASLGALVPLPRNGRRADEPEAPLGSGPGYQLNRSKYGDRFGQGGALRRAGIARLCSRRGFGFCADLGHCARFGFGFGFGAASGGCARRQR